VPGHLMSPVGRQQHLHSCVVCAGKRYSAPRMVSFWAKKETMSIGISHNTAVINGIRVVLSHLCLSATGAYLWDRRTPVRLSSL